MKDKTKQFVFPEKSDHKTKDEMRNQLLNICSER